MDKKNYKDIGEAYYKAHKEDEQPEFAEQIEDDLCIAPANIHEVFIYPFSHVQPSKVIELVQNLNQTAVDQHETLSNSAYIYRRGTHVITQIIPKNSDNSHCEQNDPE